MSEDKAIVDCIEEGREARLCSKPDSANPYPPDDQRHAAWRMGWSEADDPTNERMKGYS